MEWSEILNQLKKFGPAAKSIGMYLLRFCPPLNRELTDATVYKIENIADAMRKNSDIPMKFQDKELTAYTTDLANRAQNRVMQTEILKEENIESVVRKASYLLLANESEASDSNEKSPVSNDWIARFFDCAGDVSDCEMQQIWASILAGEIQRPKTFSLRTLEVVRNLTAKEAKIFERFAKLAIFGTSSKAIVPKDISIWEKYDISFEDALHLEDCGLFSTRDVNYHVSPPMQNDTQMIFHDKHWVVVLANNTLGIDFPCFKFTESGLQLLGLLPDSQNFEYFKDCVKYVHKFNQSANLSIHKIETIDSASGEISAQKQPVDLGVTIQ